MVGNPNGDAGRSRCLIAWLAATGCQRWRWASSPQARRRWSLRPPMADAAAGLGSGATERDDDYVNPMQQQTLLPNARSRRCNQRREARTSAAGERD